MTTKLTDAATILDPNLDRTPRERMQMCDFWGHFKYVGFDMVLYTFNDNSQILLFIR